MNKLIATQLNLPQHAVNQVLNLLSEGATVPFIARYRKERTGGLDEVQILDIAKAQDQYKKLVKRKETILETIKEQGKLTDQLRHTINDCWDSTILEDIYLPYKKSRKTRADAARELGLEPLAKIISAQRTNNLLGEAKRYCRGKVNNTEEALAGARDIIAQWINEDSRIRQSLRNSYDRYASITAKVIAKKKDEAVKYKDYHDYAGALKKTPSHRLLAMYRGEKEGLLKVGISIDTDRAHDRISRSYIRSNGACADQIDMAIADSLKRLLLPSLENEWKKKSKEKADQEAIKVFSNNLSQLLLAAPLGEVAVLALDPGFRTGCKVVVLDHHGELLHNTTIYPHPPVHKTDEADHKIRTLIHKYNISHVAIGNGTAGRETMTFIQDLGLNLEAYMVNESGASIYSASPVAREEFPDHDVTVRGAISIGRRLMDPLAELVKIEAKSIGVGQYQHDVNQTMLHESLGNTVVSAVNAVGINLNTASKYLLQYVSGIGPTLAQNIVNYRHEIGGFSSRKELSQVPRMGKKAYEQAAGFLRIKDSNELLDNTAIHPERYSLVKKILKDHKLTQLEEIQQHFIQKTIDLSTYVSDDIGMPTLKDIATELAKPGLDPRGKAQTVEFSSKIKHIEDVEVGVVLTGIVNNLTKFGAFVDIGIKESGLIHISQITDRFISDPSEVLRLSQQVEVKVMDIDLSRKRISLTMKF